MIKLIATDLDGTLLQHGAQSLSQTTIDLIKNLTAKGIVFVAASGRQYPNLHRLFQDASKEMAFICENGAIVMYKDSIVHQDAMDRNTAMSIIHDINSQPDCEVLISGKSTSFIRPKTESYYNRMKNVVKNNVTVVENFEDIKEEIYKVSLFKPQGLGQEAKDLETKWESSLKCTVSQTSWIDFVNHHVNKGFSLHKLMESLHITPEETMAFGDNYNDLEMLSAVKYGYVMDNAVEDIKNRFTYHTATVEEVLMKL